MDTEIQVQVRSYISYFNTTSDTFPWHHDLCQAIERRRALLTDMLLFDVLLSLGGIREPDALYPPRDVEQLEHLLDAISNSKYDQLKRDCLVYFLLKWYQDGREAKFQLSRCLPPQFCALSDAYWYLDSGSLLRLIPHQKAVTILADHRLVCDYASKILLAISHSEDPATLIIKYVRTAKPRLIEQEDIGIYTLALAEKHFYEAWQFQRTFNESDETRPKLLKRLFEWSVTPAPRSEPLAQLVGLPMSAYEQSIFHAYALHPPAHLTPKATAVLQDLACVRLIESGQYAEAVKLDRQFSSVSPLKGSPLTQERSQMVHDIYTALPQVERLVLDLELETQDKAMAQGGDVSMEDSRLMRTKPRLNGIASPAPSPAADRSFGFRVIPSASLNKSLNGQSNGGNGARKSLGSSAVAPLISSTSSGLASSIQPLASSSSLVPSAPAPAQKTFESANRRQNAFFQPPKDAGRRQGANSPFTFAGLNGHAPPQNDVEMDVEEVPDDDDSMDQDGGHNVPPPGEMSFSKSVFDNVPQRPAKQTNGRPSINGNARRASNTIQMPPGAFVDEERPPQPAPQPPRPQQHYEEPKRKGRESNNTNREVQQLKMSIPGSLMDDDDEEEEDDDVAPLRAPSPPPKRTTRKARSESTEESQGRRRSSRLSAVPAEPKAAAATSSKRKTTSTTTKSRKKRS
ncbi:hypothetical protein BDZ89DRAFT_1069706 [Hymenopellis radicata]|nr:hypothetical protein BDZ89DRAFT_1069706 [Hymenopellis radicata]